MLRNFCLVGAVLALVVLPAYAGDRITQSNDNNTTGDVTVAGDSSDSLAIGYGPDNDINDCMAHWSAIVVTFPTRNKFCQRLELVRWAENPDRHTEASVKIMCADKIAIEVFGSASECETVFEIPEEVPRGEPNTSLEEPDLTPILSRLSELESRNSELQATSDELQAAVDANERQIQSNGESAFERRARAAREALREDDDEN